MPPIPERPPTPSPTRRAGVTIGGVLAVVALLAGIAVGYLLLRDGGGDVPAETAQSSGSLREDFDAAEVRDRLATLRADIEAGLDESAIRERYDEIRADLEAGYADASADAARTWETLQPRLDALGERIGASSEEAVASIDALLDAFPEE